MLARLDYLGRKPEIDVGPIFSALTAELVKSPTIDPLRLQLQLDWIQYRSNFRPPVTLRRFLDAPGPAPAVEVAVDVRRLDACDLSGEFRQLLGDTSEGAWDDEWLALEDATSPASSLIWAFNRLYWEHLSLWETTFQQDYASALPGGESDGTNADFWRDRIAAFLDVLDELQHDSIVPEEIFVLELGVGSGHQACAWLDTFRGMSAQRGRDYYERVRYLMADYSVDVLTTAREATGEHRDQVSILNLDATNVLESLTFLRYKVLFVHSCNLYDNLPTDEIVRVDHALYQVRSRAAVRRVDVETICGEHDVCVDDFAATLDRLLRIGPEVFDDAKSGVRFWADVWEALVLHEDYEPVDPAEVVLVDDGSLTLDDVIDALPQRGRCHLSTGAIRSFANTLPLLHPRGSLQVQDLFLTRPNQYSGAFRGPGKLEGSIVNWLNGPLFSAIAERLGFHLRFEAFSRYREKSNTVVLTTVPKD